MILHCVFKGLKIQNLTRQVLPARFERVFLAILDTAFDTAAVYKKILTRIRQKFPVRVPVIVIWLARLKAKPAAKHANAHPKRDWSYRICNQPCAPSPVHRTGFKPDTTRAD